MATLPPAPLWRRLAALGYDLLLLIALVMITTGVLLTLYTLAGLPMHDAGGIERPPQIVLQGILLPLLALEIWAFYAWFWLHGGQTLGMKTWHLHLRRTDEHALTLLDTAKRFAAGIITWLLLGAGYLLALIPPHQTLHDRLSATHTVLLPKPARKK